MIQIILFTAHTHTQSYRSRIDVLLDNEEECAGGVFQQDVTDPEVSSSSSTHLWELATLRVRERERVLRVRERERDSIVCVYEIIILFIVPF